MVNYKLDRSYWGHCSCSGKTPGPDFINPDGSSVLLSE